MCRLKENSEFSKPLLAYVASNIGFEIISRVHSFYYVKVFLEIYHIQPGWFQCAQVLYMIWNTINDPLFAYFQDVGYFGFLKTRKYSVYISAPLWALSFLLNWFPWETNVPSTWITGVHLITALCAYDTMFTFLGLANCTLFTEISQDHSIRIQLLRWSKLSNFFVAGFIFLCEYESESLKVFWKFQLVCILVAITSFFLIRYAGTHADTEYERKGLTRSADNTTDSMFRLTLNILTNRNFIAFVVVNFSQEFHATFLANFMAIICENLIPTSVVNLSMRSFLYFVQGLLPTIIVIFGAPIMQITGYYKLIRFSCLLKFILAATLYVLGPTHSWIIIITMVIDGGVNSAASSMYNLALSDVVDEDKTIHNRVLPNSAVVYGTNALVVKSVYSITPMVVALILNHYGYDRLKSGIHQLTNVEEHALHGAMFNLVCFIPIVVAIIQTVSWSFYQLRDTHRLK